MKAQLKTTLLSLFILLAVLPSGVFAQTADESAFFNLCGTIAKEYEGDRVIPGKAGWLFLQAELDHLSKGVFWGEAAAGVAANLQWADPLPAIIDFNSQLKDMGVELILLPVPAKAVVYPDMINGSQPPPGTSRLDYYHRNFYQKLESAGVSVLDILPALLEARDAGNQVYCETDAHWAPFAIRIAAAAAAEQLKNRPWYGSVPKIDVQSKTETISFTGDLADGIETSAYEELPANIITGSAGTAVMPSENSPVILLGDSHTLVFHQGGDMLAKGAGLPDQLAYTLGFTVDLIGVRGSGSTAARINLFRKSKRDKEYLSGKKAVIWCFTVREFTESTGGWRIVPVSP